jgi:hypothetical protein
VPKHLPRHPKAEVRASPLEMGRTKSFQKTSQIKTVKISN